jgi:Rod binding domain-containing protein
MLDSISLPVPFAPNAGATGAVSRSECPRDTPDTIARAATQFEALLIGEVLKSAREADGSSWTGSEEDEAGSTLMEVSEQQISSALAAKGGLGLATILSAGLSKKSDQFASRTFRQPETR